MKPDEIRTFDAQQEFSVFDRHLPHWSQAGALCFITWRLIDSLPNSVLGKLDAEIAQLLLKFGVSAPVGGAHCLDSIPAQQRVRCHWEIFATRDKFLDSAHGSCLLRKPAHSKQVLDSLRHFDGDRYFLTDAVIMPNHVHFIAAFPNEESMLAQCENWKRFTSRKINDAEGITGRFWQPDQFDHLIRSDAHFEYFRRYIANNPIKANLKADCFLHYQKQLLQ